MTITADRRAVPQLDTTIEQLQRRIAALEKGEQEWREREKAWRRRERSSLGAFAAAAAVLALAATWRYGVEWTRVVAPLARAAEVQTRYSLVRLLQGAGIPAVPAAVLLSAAALAVAGLLVRAALTGRALLGLAACALVLLSPWLLPWYVVWPVSLAAAERGREGRLAALALTGYLLSARVSL